MKIADMMWLSFHVVGLTAAALTGLWLHYWGVFAIAEGVGLLSQAPFTTSVRQFLRGAEDGALGVWRPVLVLAWSTGVVATWWYFAPFPSEVKGPVGLIFGIWVFIHFVLEKW